jgi:hypothetical protein
MRFTREAELMKVWFDNTEKHKTKFLWFPVTIHGETRWLETATITYRVKKDWGAFLGDYYYWKAWEFVDEEGENNG